MIDPITALATFNAACAVVKETANHANDMVSLFKGIGDMMKAKQAVDEACRNDPDQSDLELFAAHVEMEQEWERVKEMLKWTGHWDNYLKFCADRREKEKQARIAEIKKKQAKVRFYKDIAIIIGGVIATILICGAFLLAISNAKGAI